MQYLPPNIVHFVLWCGRLAAPLQWRLFPRRLRSLRLVCPLKHLPQADDVRCFPPTIEELAYHCAFNHVVMRNETRFDLLNYRSPPQLKSLTFSVNPYAKLVNVDLPMNLERLLFCGHIRVRVWPPRLQTLKLDRAGLKRIDCSNFPQTLTSLDLSSNGLSSINGLSTLKNLNRLELFGNLLEELTDVPTRLVKLDLAGNFIRGLDPLKMPQTLRWLRMDRKIVEGPFSRNGNGWAVYTVSSDHFVLESLDMAQPIPW